MTVKKVVLYSIIGFIITALVVGVTFYFVAQKKVNQEPKEIKTYIYSIGELYANVKDSRKILKVNLDVEISDEKLTEKLNSKRSEITNNILELLRSKSEVQLSGDEGQQALRKEILKSIKLVLPSEDIIDVYFIEFIIQ
ncbi:hypothetical protein FQB35_07690 [Crassaminicella thermophila]|uniref:Flagellar protein FliL n=1 Tax=Crassaminicella thermophila TaxID=2599308 RepID=A0A5C0SEV6_CRATE|nr:flagellar basal body-associated FliL family protein [Crassaminicella thermophila]QEK12267.1 hypothetical protein FQB35_07690 [Crassaminicella thermophila]